MSFMAIVAGLFILGRILAKIVNENNLVDRSIDAVRKSTDSNKTICNRCGRSVAFGTSLWTNRIRDFDSLEIRKSKGAKYPGGEFICGDCRKKIYQERKK
ncbi:MAG: hypothetical protein KC414_13810 [Romboutsia sp.]|nr:hypothetical protein [Romboutsia sp.]